MLLLSVRLYLYFVICVSCVTAMCQIYGNQAVCQLRDIWYNEGVQWHKLTLVRLRKADQRFFGKWIFRNNPQLNQLVIENSRDFGTANMFRDFRVEHINYSNNFLPIVPANMFSDCSVKQLTLNNNHIKTLQPGCFRNLPSLKYLSVQGNHIKILRKWIFNKLSVTELRLSKNEISIIKPGTFFNMYSLTILYLDHNSLHTFSSRSLLGRGCNLELLDLSYNYISKVNKPMLDFLTNLKVLNLANNKITVIEHGVFQQLSQIRTINLQRNYLKLISCLVFPPYGLYYLHEFNVGGNNIKHLSRQLLDRLRTVKNICVGQNPLQCSTHNAVLQWTIQNNIYCSDALYNLERKWCGYSFPQFHQHHHHHHHHHHYYPCSDAGCTNANGQGDYKHLIDVRFGLKETIQNSSQEILTSEESDSYGASNLTSVDLDYSTSFEVNDTSEELDNVPVLMNRFNDDKEEEFDYDDLLNYINNTSYESDDIYNSTINYEQDLTTTENTFNVTDSPLNVSETLRQNLTEYGNYEEILSTKENVINASDSMINVTETTMQNVTEYNFYDKSTEEYLELTSKTTEQLPTTTAKNNVEDDIPVISFGFGFYDE